MGHVHHLPEKHFIAINKLEQSHDIPAYWLKEKEMKTHYLHFENRMVLIYKKKITEPPLSMNPLHQ